MLGLARNTDISTTIRNEVVTYLYDVFTSEEGTLASLDRWTRRRVMDENVAKIALVLEADDPEEHCYQNLVREIDTEAETGIFLAKQEADRAELCELASDPGVSGRLHEQMQKIAPVMFADELAHSYRDMDLVWVTIHASYDRAKVDATVSEIILTHLTDDGPGVTDMSSAMRSLLYSFHEDLVRRLTGLPQIIDEGSTRELVLMVSELADRAGDYGPRVDAISERACDL